MSRLFFFLSIISQITALRFFIAPTDENTDLKPYCKSVYLDIGSNIGVQVRKLFEPKHYLHARVQSVFEKYFGKAEFRSLPSEESGICAVGFEANHHWVDRLKAVESYHQTQKWSSKFLVPRVVSDVDDRNVTFWEDSHGSFLHNLGASSNKAQAKGASKDNNVVPFTVQSLDITKYIKMNVLSSKRTTVVAKMDIEGSEYVVLPKMIEEGLLCDDKITAMFVEWHGLVPAGYDQGMDQKHLKKKLLAQIAKGSTCKSGPTDMLEVDDETYKRDKDNALPVNFAHNVENDLQKHMHITAEIYAAAREAQNPSQF